MKSKEKRAAEIQEDIRQVLLKDWDPIGVRNEPDLKDEYNSYIGKIYRRLASKASEADIVELLYKIEKEEMGSSPDEERLRPVAGKLFKLNVSL